MKNYIILGFCSFIFASTFAQIRLHSKSSHRYEDSNYVSGDSTIYEYPFGGFINSDFIGYMQDYTKTQDGNLSWQIPTLRISSTSENSFFYNVGLNTWNQFVTTLNTLLPSNDNLVSIQQNSMSKVDYLYDNNENLIEKNTSILSGATYVLIEKINQSFDSFNNLVEKKIYNYTSGIANPMYSLDSIRYNANGLISEKKTFDVSALAANLTLRIVYNESAGQIVSANITPYTAGISPSFISYGYTNSLLSNISFFHLTAGVPNITPTFTQSYSFANSKIATISYSSDLFLLTIDSVSYNPQGFLTKVKKTTFNTPVTIPVVITDNYYYCSVANLVENSAIEVSVYPNPATDAVHVTSVSKISEMALYSLDGKILMKVVNDNVLNIANVALGNYILKIYTEDGFISKSISKL